MANLKKFSYLFELFCKRYRTEIIAVVVVWAYLALLGYITERDRIDLLRMSCRANPKQSECSTIPQPQE